MCSSSRKVLSGCETKDVIDKNSLIGFKGRREKKVIKDKSMEEATY